MSAYTIDDGGGFRRILRPDGSAVAIVLSREAAELIVAELNRLITPDVFWMTNEEADAQHVDDNVPVSMSEMIDWRFPGDVFAVHQARKLSPGYYVVVDTGHRIFGPGTCLDGDPVTTARPATAEEIERCRSGERKASASDGAGGSAGEA